MESSSCAAADRPVGSPLLRSVVVLARHVYAAAASSVLMSCPDTGELVFAAVAGEGEQDLVGRRLPPGTGIAGWVAASCQQLVVDQVDDNDLFARDVAAATGYVPTSIMAAPLVCEGACLGVLEVLDRRGAPADATGELDDLRLLELLADDAARSLDLLLRPPAATPAAPPMGNLLQKLNEHATLDSSDPLAIDLLKVSLRLLDRSRDE